MQARMGSERLPGKTLMKLGDKLLIDHVLERALITEEVDCVVLATTELPEDDELVKYVSRRYSVKIYRGSPKDVRSRFVNIAEQTCADIIIRITADDPFKDPIETLALINLLTREKLDYVCNFVPQELPIGMDAEAFTSAALFNSAQLFNSPLDLEHVTWSLRSSYYNWKSISHSVFQPQTRLTVDIPSDLDYCSDIAATLRDNALGFSWSDTRRAIQIRDGHPRV